jgi:FAD:protein FMN transferase
MATQEEPARRLVERRAEMMGTTVSVHLAVEPDHEPEAQDIATACMEWLHEVDKHLSRFRPESELCQLNRSSGHWFSASSLLYAAVAEAVNAADASDGLFDPTLLTRLEALGYDRDFDQIAQREVTATAEPEATPAGGGWRDIELDARHRRIRLPTGIRLDLGGIAKGWAADVALERFCGPCPGALVNVGGDLRAHGGPQPGEGWAVGILGPGRPENSSGQQQVATITFSRGGLATSGALKRWWYAGGTRRHHLLDPRTGLPALLWVDGSQADERDSSAPLLATATALAATAARAEVAAKVALLRGLPAALERVEADWNGQGKQIGAAQTQPTVALLLTLGNGELRLSANLREYLATWATEGAPVPYYVQTVREQFEQPARSETTRGTTPVQN